jgi:SAM-dependent methyltransferase
MKHSSSIHSLNADKGLRRPQQALWFLLNWVNNDLFPNATNSSLVIKDFVCDISDEDWRQLDVKTTPLRRLCDLFWLKLPWASIQSDLGQINVLDAGCGTGKYGVKLQSYSDHRIASYVGVDITRRDNWDTLAEKHGNLRFYQLDSKNILERIPEESNFFMTQAAIEHFDEDLLFFEQIRDFALRTSRNIIQVHLFPSPACLWLYLLHGVRQYTPRTISKITQIFEEFSYSVLFRLGGKECSSFYWNSITKPMLRKVSDMRETRTREYDRESLRVIKADMLRPQKSPSFYALVIHSNWRKEIF